MTIAAFKFSGHGNLASQIESANLSNVDRINLSIPKNVWIAPLYLARQIKKAERLLDLEIRITSEHSTNAGYMGGW